MLSPNAFLFWLLPMLQMQTSASFRKSMKMQSEEAGLASVKEHAGLGGSSVPPDPPALEAAIARWVDKGMKTYIKERARAMRASQCSGVGVCKETLSPVKVAFVFMVYQEVRFPQLWENFFRASPAANYTILVHAMNETSAAVKMTPFFKQNLISIPAKGEWCHFSRIQLALIRHAFLDEAVTHLMWISGDAVPLQRLEAMSTDIGSMPMRSFFCVDPLSGSRAEMWTVLARPHALALAMNEDALYDIYHRYDNLCEDEQIFYQPLITLGVGKNSLVDRCIMWTAWGHWGMKERRDVNPDFNSAVSVLTNTTGLQVRSRQFQKRVNSSAHPALWSFVPADGLQHLMNKETEFFFARKFTSNCVVQSSGIKVPLADFIAHQLMLTNTSAPILSAS